MPCYTSIHARMAELVDAHGSGPCAARCGGSSPLPGTKNRKASCNSKGLFLWSIDFLDLQVFAPIAIEGLALSLEISDPDLSPVSTTKPLELAVWGKRIGLVK